MTMEVLMNFDKSNQFNQSFLHMKLFTLMTMGENSNLVCWQTIEVLMNFEKSYQFNWEAPIISKKPVVHLCLLSSIF